MRSLEDGFVINMLRDLELPSLQQRRECNILVFLFKIAGGMMPAINSEDCLKNNERNTELRPNILVTTSVQILLKKM